MTDYVVDGDTIQIETQTHRQDEDFFVFGCTWQFGDEIGKEKRYTVNLASIDINSIQSRIESEITAAIEDAKTRYQKWKIAQSM